MKHIGAVIVSGVLLAVVSLNSGPGSQVSFIEVRQDFGFFFPYFMAVDDLNRDGISDLVVGSCVDHGTDVALLFGDGSGGFMRSFLTAVDTPLGVTICDLNRDGFPDIVATNHNADLISVFLADGAGGYAPRVDLASGDSKPYTVAAGDINRDGKPDLAVGHYYGGGATTVSIFVNETPAGSPSPAFGPPSLLVIGDCQWDIALGDLDLDGKLDLAVLTTDGRLAIYRGDGAGGFTPSQVIAVPAIDVDIADVNEDGNPDLIVANGNDYTAGILLGDGTGAFGSMTEFAVLSTALSVGVDDINGDGRKDLAVGTEGSGLFVFVADESGGYSAPQNFPTGTRVGEIVFADFNRDGKRDMAVANELSHAVSVLLNTTPFPPSGQLVSAPPMAVGDTQWDIALGDLDIDGKLDLAVLTTGERLAIYRGDGTGGFYATQVIAVPAIDVDIADINADGKPDLIVANGNDHTAGILLGDGVGAFGSMTEFAVLSTALSVGVDDINGDGRKDLAVGTEDSGLFVFIADESGGYSTPQNLTTGTRVGEIVFADFNRDSRCDMAVANELSHTVSVLLADGEDGFSIRTESFGFFFPYFMAVDDLNRDGISDLVVGSCVYHGTDVALLFGDGSGGFTRSFLTAVDTPLGVTTCDLNRDGFPDIVATNHNADLISVFLADGAGGYAPRVDLASGDGSPYTVAAGDINRDGKPDLSVGHYYGKGATTASVFLNSTNSPPVAMDQALVVDGGVLSGIPTEVVLGASDPDGDSLAYSILSIPSHGSLSGTPPRLTYQSEASYFGSDSFTFKVNDGKADSSVATVTITVKRSYAFYGFDNPIDNYPIVNNAKSGSSIPVKWRITDISGTAVSDTGSFKTLTSYSVSCGTFMGDPVDELEAYSSNASGLRYLGDGYWQFNWKTLKNYAGQCRIMVLTLADGSMKTACFKFK